MVKQYDVLVSFGIVVGFILKYCSIRLSLFHKKVLVTICAKINRYLSLQFQVK